MSEAATWQAACPVCILWGGLQRMPSRVCCSPLHTPVVVARLRPVTHNLRDPRTGLMGWWWKRPTTNHQQHTHTVTKDHPQAILVEAKGIWHTLLVVATLGNRLEEGGGAGVWKQDVP